MPPDPSVSILLPVHNAGPTLSRTLDSALNQTLGDLEVVILDDGSDDGAVEATLTGNSDPRIRHLDQQERRGAAETWNSLLSAARGEFVKLLPQDDLMAPEQLEQEVAALRGDPMAVGAFSRFQAIDDGDRRLGPVLGARALVGRVTAADLALAALRIGGNPVGPPGTVLARRGPAVATGYRASAGYVIDLDHVLRLAEHGHLIAVEAVLHRFRVHGSSWTSRLATEQLGAFARLQPTLVTVVITAGATPPRLIGARVRLRTALRRLTYRLVGRRVRAGRR